MSEGTAVPHQKTDDCNHFPQANHGDNNQLPSTLQDSISAVTTAQPTIPILPRSSNNHEKSIKVEPGISEKVESESFQVIRPDVSIKADLEHSVSTVTMAQPTISSISKSTRNQEKSIKIESGVLVKQDTELCGRPEIPMKIDSEHSPHIVASAQFTATSFPLTKTPSEQHLFIRSLPNSVRNLDNSVKKETDILVKGETGLSQFSSPEINLKNEFESSSGIIPITVLKDSPFMQSSESHQSSNMVSILRPDILAKVKHLKTNRSILSTETSPPEYCTDSPLLPDHEICSDKVSLDCSEIGIIASNLCAQEARNDYSSRRLSDEEVVRIQHSDPAEESDVDIDISDSDNNGDDISGNSNRHLCNSEDLVYKTLLKSVDEGKNNEKRAEIENDVENAGDNVAENEMSREVDTTESETESEEESVIRPECKDNGRFKMKY